MAWIVGYFVCGALYALLMAYFKNDSDSFTATIRVLGWAIMAPYALIDFVATLRKKPTDLPEPRHGVE